MVKNTKAGQNGNKKKTSKEEKGMSSPEQGLQELFTDELKDIYWAEKALTKAIPKMIKKTTSQELKSALEQHLEVTNQQVTRVEQVFQKIDEKAQAKKCEAMDGLIKEAEEIMASAEEGVVRDAGIISAGKKVEHYEIASYSSLVAFAKTLGHEEAASLLEQTLKEEKEADEKLSEISESITMEAMGEGSEEAETILASDSN